jgi:hypothetical protein
MCGTNTGPLQGNPPTGNAIALPGADVIEVEGDKVRSVQGYFDQKTFVEQLGLQALVLPIAIGPVTFGSSARFSTGKPVKPGAISLTWIQVRSQDEANEVNQRSMGVIEQLAQMPGFVGWTGADADGRMATLTAWETPADAAALLKGGPHREAMDGFFNGGLGVAGFTSVWVPDRLNAVWVRCTACGNMQDHERSGGVCRCGATLPEPPPYW